MADFLDEKRREIASRLKELEPLVQEHDRLRAALDALDGVGGRGAARRLVVHAGRLGPRAPRRRRALRRWRRARAPARHGHALEGGPRARPHPPRHLDPRDGRGRWGSSRTTSTACSPALQKDGLVRKDGRGWHATEAA